VPENRKRVTQLAQHMIESATPDAAILHRQTGTQTYALSTKPGEFVPASITCLKWGNESHNLNDVKNRYCGHCHEFHEQ
jgi:hypothetical protein